MNAEHETVVLEGMDSSIMVFYMFITYVTYCFYVERSLPIQSIRRRNVINAVNKRSVQVVLKHSTVCVVYQGEREEFVRVEYFVWLSLRCSAHVT